MNGDDRLLPLLEQHGVATTVEDTTGGSWLLDLATGLLPMALLVGMICLHGTPESARAADHVRLRRAAKHACTIWRSQE